MQHIDVRLNSPHEYSVTLTGGTTTRHIVRVPPELLDELSIPDLDEERLVRESFAFLLEREPATSILNRFGLDVISRYFPDYVADIRKRVK